MSKDMIMAVDDDPAILETVRMILGSSGLEARTVGSGQECLRALHQGFRGLILMDIMMPGMDGWDTVAAMRSEGVLDGNIVCMMTAVQDPGPKLEYLKECVLDYVRKPFTPEELLSAVETSTAYLKQTPTTERQG
jgi:CheY-like chemotaxis protein